MATNPQGSNLPPGLVAGLARSEPGAAAALEVDEAWLGAAAAALRPATFTLLNLTRDQLDRVAEVRRLADRWRAVVAAQPPTTHVVANADDPLVAWAAARRRPAVTWVGAGQPGSSDAAGCPACGGRIRCGAEGGGGRARAAAFARPEPAVWVDGEDVVASDGGRHRLRLAPARPGQPGQRGDGRGDRRRVLGVGLGEALAAMADTVDGRRALPPGGRSAASRARLLLAKNPAGWMEVFDMLAPPPGRSWSSSTPASPTAGTRPGCGTCRSSASPAVRWRPAASASRDLAVRLHYAEVEHRRIPDPIEAIGAVGPGPVDVAANYTALRDLDARLGRRPDRGGRGPRPRPRLAACLAPADHPQVIRQGRSRW